MTQQGKSPKAEVNSLRPMSALDLCTQGPVDELLCGSRFFANTDNNQMIDTCIFV